MLNIDFGFLVVKKHTYAKLKKLKFDSFSELSQRVLLNTQFNDRVLKNIIFSIDAEMFNKKKQIGLIEIKRSEDNSNLRKIFNLLISSLSPISDFFFLKPAFHLTLNNYNLLATNSFIKSFCEGIYTPVNFVEIEFSSCLYKLEFNEFQLFIRDIENVCLQDVCDNLFDCANIEFVKSILKDITFDEYDIFFMKTI